MQNRLLLTSVALFALPACSRSTGGSTDGIAGPAAAGTPTFHRDVQPILARYCLGCHGREGSIFSLEEYSQAAALAGPIAHAVGERRMPPWPPAAGCGEFAGAEQRTLSAEEVATLMAWQQAGAPEGDPVEPAPPVRAAAAAEPALVLDPGGEYSYTGAEEDQYWCFRLDPGLSGPLDVVAMDIQPGNRAIVHHVIVFREPDGRGKPTGLPGFRCGGVPGGTEFMAGWVPGATPLHLPAGMAMRLDPSDALVMQVHYHRNPAEVTATDRSRLRVFTATSPVNEYVRVVWTGSIDIDVPPRASASASGTCRLPETGGPVKLVSVAPHMHTAGSSFRSEIRRADGSTECLIDIPRWDFEWQGGYQYTIPRQLQPGDTIHTACSYDNRSDRRVRFGEGTGDEMCFQFNFVVDDGVLPDWCFAPCDSLPCQDLF
jgi:hypothetical protein